MLTIELEDDILSLFCLYIFFLIFKGLMTALPFFTFPILQELYIKSKYEVQLCV